MRLLYKADGFFTMSFHNTVPCTDFRFLTLSAAKFFSILSIFVLFSNLSSSFPVQYFLCNSFIRDSSNISQLAHLHYALRSPTLTNRFTIYAFLLFMRSPYRQVLYFLLHKSSPKHTRPSLISNFCCKLFVVVHFSKEFVTVGRTYYRITAVYIMSH